MGMVKCGVRQASLGRGSSVQWEARLAWEDKSYFSAEYSGLDCGAGKTVLLCAAKCCDLGSCKCTVSCSADISQISSPKGFNYIFLLEYSDNFVV